MTSRMMSGILSNPHFYITKETAWICLPSQLVSFDLATGAKGKTVPLPGRLASFTAQENVLLVPHLASATTETRTAMANLAVDNVAAVLAGRAPITPVLE